MRSNVKDFRSLLRSTSWAERLAVVRGYYPGFSAKDGYDLRRPARWTAKQKRLVTTHFTAIRPFLGAPLVKKKARNKDEASAAWRFLFGTEPPKGTLYVPILEHPANKPQLVFKTTDEGEVELASVRLRGGVNTNIHYFEDYGIGEKQLAITGAESDEAILAMLRGTNGTHFALVTGDYLYHRGGKPGAKEEVFMGKPEDVLRQIRRMQNTYGDKKKNNYWANWLQGVKSYTFKSGEKAIAYRRRVKKTRMAYLGEKKKLKSLNLAIYRGQQSLKESAKRLAVVEKNIRAVPKAAALFKRSPAFKYELQLKAKYKRQIDKTLGKVNAAIKERNKLITTMVARKVT